jgi:tRNA(Arg) A34 adenosine deaminase TadA
VRILLVEAWSLAQSLKNDHHQYKGNSMPLPPLDHHHFLTLAYDVARRAHDEGSHPFGAILVDEQGEVLMEQGNAYRPYHDMTGHAERVLMTRASQTWRPQYLATCTMYTSAEPCAMCSGAAYWAGIGRVVYGLSEARLKQITGDHPENPTLDLPCRTVFASGQRRVEVIGPLLEDEGAALHDGVW